MRKRTLPRINFGMLAVLVTLCAVGLSGCGSKTDGSYLLVTETEMDSLHRYEIEVSDSKMTLSAYNQDGSKSPTVTGSIDSSKKEVTWDGGNTSSFSFTDDGSSLKIDLADLGGLKLTFSKKGTANYKKQDESWNKREIKRSADKDDEDKEDDASSKKNEKTNPNLLLGTWQGSLDPACPDKNPCQGASNTPMVIKIKEVNCTDDSTYTGCDRLLGTEIKGTVSAMAHFHGTPQSEVAGSAGDEKIDLYDFSSRLEKDQDGTYTLKTIATAPDTDKPKTPNYSSVRTSKISHLTITIDQNDLTKNIKASLQSEFMSGSATNIVTGNLTDHYILSKVDGDRSSD